jgi:hypothetical protein
MLEEILSENFVRAEAASAQPLFSTDSDYGALSAQYRSLVQSWSKLSPQEQEQFGTQKKYLAHHNAPNLNDPALTPSKHFMLVRNEVEKRVKETLNIAWIADGSAAEA